MMQYYPGVVGQTAVALLALALVLAIARRLALPLGGGESVVTQLGALFLAALLVLILAGNVLLSLNAFTRPVVLGFLAGWLLLIRRKMPLPLPLPDFSRWPRSTRWAAGTGLLLLLPALLRPLLVPILAWDTVGYHAVRAAIWVKTGAWSVQPAPGGWWLHQLLPGGGELLTAWGMLFYHRDIFAMAVDVPLYLMLAVVMYALAVDLGAGSLAAVAVTFYLLTLPSFRLAVGSGYVDNTLVLVSLLALLFGGRFMRGGGTVNGTAAIVAGGLAAGVKHTGWPLLMVIAVLLAGCGLRRDGALVTMRWLMPGILVVLVITGAWVANNLQATGLPLGVTPVTVAGIVLGQPSAAVNTLMTRPELVRANWRSEVDVLVRVFAAPWRTHPHLSVLTLPLLAIGFRQLLRAGRATILPLLATLIVAGCYYLPEMACTRLLCAGMSGRFLGVAVAVLLAAAAGRQPVWLARVITGYALGGGLAHLLLTFSWGWLPEREIPFQLGAGIVAVAAVTVVLLVLRRQGQHGWRWLIGAAVPLALLVAPVIDAQQRVLRQEFIRTTGCMTLQALDRYWQPATEILAAQPPQRIAVTSGPWHYTSNWLMYHLLGNDLQHDLYYVPPTADGLVCDYFTSAVTLEELSSFPAWQERLRARQITRVMCFWPPAMELSWMEARPGSFRRLAGDGKIWGLYQVDP